jgi:hypothetical protein
MKLVHALGSMLESYDILINNITKDSVLAGVIRGAFYFDKFRRKQSVDSILIITKEEKEHLISSLEDNDRIFNELYRYLTGKITIKN